MEISERDPEWENPYFNINYSNYLDGTISDHCIAFQDLEWYEENKDNFCNSLREKYPEYLPSFARKILNEKKNLPSNYLGFYPYDFVRFGFLEQITIDIDKDGAKVKFWVVRIPEGMRIYHSSRLLGLNHSDFPVVGYSNEKTSKQNKEFIAENVPTSDFIGHSVEEISEGPLTYASFYSTPLQTGSYLQREIFKDVNYAYGINSDSTNSNINDRYSFQANDQFIGIQSYIVKKDSYFMIFALDDILIERPDFGKVNMQSFMNVMEYIKGNIMVEFDVNEPTFNRFIEILKIVSGIGTFEDTVSNFEQFKENFKDYEQSRNEVEEWLNYITDYYVKNKLNSQTPGKIKEISEKVLEMRKIGEMDLNSFENIRFSDSAYDRSVVNMILWLLTVFKTYIVDNEAKTRKRINMRGLISTTLYRPYHPDWELTTIVQENIPYFSPKNLYSLFHSEVVCFYAPNVLNRDKNNIYDLEYSLNYNGIAQELRKYKTANLLREENDMVVGFHQGHLYEHSVWVGILAEK